MQCYINYDSQQFQLNNDFKIIYLNSNTTDTSLEAKVADALQCNISLVDEGNLLSSQILSKFLFLNLTNTELSSNRSGCFYLQMQDTLTIQYSSTCSDTFRPVLCQSTISNHFAIGKSIDTILPLLSTDLCPSGYSLSSPRNHEEIQNIILLMTDNKVKEAWTSLYLKDVVGDNYEWIQILPQQESNETLGKLESDNAVVMLALGVSFLVIVAGLILLFMCSKKKKVNDPSKKKLIPTSDSDKPPLSDDPLTDSPKKKTSQPPSTKAATKKNRPKQRFISDTSFNGNEFKTTNALKLDEVHHFAIVDNENILTNIDNSPKSLDGSSHQSSMRVTPKNVDFNIEFSMIEQDSKIKTQRDAFEIDVDEEHDQE